MPLMSLVIVFLLLAGCSAPEKPGSIDDLPPLVNEVVPAPPEVVYTRMSEGLSTCFGASSNLSIYEDSREFHQVIGIITNDLSLGYNAMMKATVAPGPDGATRVSYSWANPFWEGHTRRLQRWAHGESPDDC